MVQEQAVAARDNDAPDFPVPALVPAGPTAVALAQAVPPDAAPAGPASDPMAVAQPALPFLQRAMLALNLRQQVAESAPRPPENAGEMVRHVQAHQQAQAALLNDMPGELPGASLVAVSGQGRDVPEVLQATVPPQAASGLMSRADAIAAPPDHPAAALQQWLSLVETRGVDDVPGAAPGTAAYAGQATADPFKDAGAFGLRENFVGISGYLDAMLAAAGTGPFVLRGAGAASKQNIVIERGEENAAGWAGRYQVKVLENDGGIPDGHVGSTPAPALQDGSQPTLGAMQSLSPAYLSTVYGGGLGGDAPRVFDPGKNTFLFNNGNGTALAIEQASNGSVVRAYADGVDIISADGKTHAFVPYMKGAMPEALINGEVYRAVRDRISILNAKSGDDPFYGFLARHVGWVPADTSSPGLVAAEAAEREKLRAVLAFNRDVREYGTPDIQKVSRYNDSPLAALVNFVAARLTSDPGKLEAVNTAVHAAGGVVEARMGATPEQKYLNQVRTSDSVAVQSNIRTAATVVASGSARAASQESDARIQKGAHGFNEVVTGSTPLEAYARLNTADVSGSGGFNRAEAALGARLEPFLGRMRRAPFGASYDFLTENGRKIDVMYSTKNMTEQELEGMNRFYEKSMTVTRGNMRLPPGQRQILDHLQKSDIVPVDFMALSPANQKIFINYIKTLSPELQAKILIVR